MSHRIAIARRTVCAAAVLALLAIAGTSLRAAPEAPKPAAKNSALEAMKPLVGTWVAVAAPDHHGKGPVTVTFKESAAGSAIVETMLPGSEQEMITIYAIDGQSLLMTHYCMMGNQPRMRLTSAEKGVLKFEFIDGGNLKSRDEVHMDSLEMTITADRLIEKWGMYQDGKVVGYHTFEYKRQG